MLGFNGGLIGASRDTTNTRTLPGVWTVAENILARRKELWPNPDPHFASVSLLLYCNGTAGSTTFTDSSPTPKTVTAAGNAQISTTQSKFGGASAAFDGTGDRLDIASNSAFDLESGAYTVEFFLWFNSRVSGSRTVVFEGSTETVGLIAMGTNNNDFNANIFGSTSPLTGSGFLSGKDNQWIHVALCSDGTTRRLFGNGSLLSSTTSRVLPSGNCSIGIGGNTVRFTASNLNGYIDELRITKGVGRYTANFTIPTAPFSDF